MIQKDNLNTRMNTTITSSVGMCCICRISWGYQYKLIVFSVSFVIKLLKHFAGQNYY